MPGPSRFQKGVTLQLDHSLTSGGGLIKRPGPYAQWDLITVVMRPGSLRRRNSLAINSTRGFCSLPVSPVYPLTVNNATSRSTRRRDSLVRNTIWCSAQEPKSNKNSSALATIFHSVIVAIVRTADVAGDRTVLAPVYQGRWYHTWG